MMKLVKQFDAATRLVSNDTNYGHTYYYQTRQVGMLPGEFEWSTRCLIETNSPEMDLVESLLS